MKKKKQQKSARPLSRSLRVYQKLSLLFFVFSVLLLLGVLYLSLSQAVIRIAPIPRAISSSIAIDVHQNPGALQVAGEIAEVQLERTKTVTLQGNGTDPVKGRSSGMVFVVNETSGQVDLVANTRVLSDSGILFRLQEAVSVPANDQVEVAVLADEEGEEGDIEPSRFTIPGLPENAQTVVYAISTKAMVGGLRFVRVISQDDLERAEVELTAELLKQGIDELKGTETRDFDDEIFDIEILTRITNAAIGEEASSFDIGLSARIFGVFFDASAFQTQVENGLRLSADDGFELVSIYDDVYRRAIQFVDVQSGVARIAVTVDMLSIITNTNELLNLDQFLGKAPGEVEAILEASEAIESASISFTPFWLKRIPTLRDHIKVVIEGLK
ncbi:MAG: hypothetical protein O3B64_00635 [bacterium]|nr:hypothetical protein [bacterium]MDA1024705.1 hypothetical protein [bacterium]